MTQSVAFESVVEKVGEAGGWHIVRIPTDVVEKLRELSGKKGNIPVVCRIGKTEWASTIMSMGDQQWFVAVKASVRASEHIGAGDSVEVVIRPDSSRLKKRSE